MNKFGLAGFFALCSFTGSANAGLIGDNVGFALTVPGTSIGGVINHTVGAGEEGNYIFQFYDFGDYSFAIRSSNLYCGFACRGATITLALSDLDFGAPLTNVILTTSLIGVTLDFGSDFVNFYWTDQTLNPETYISAVFETGNASVPEPSTLALLGLGLLGIGHSRKRKTL